MPGRLGKRELGRVSNGRSEEEIHGLRNIINGA